ncbi:MAG: hypothetical protein CM15mV11_1540 [Caudoviricetes sp.]|nr:MAG: hypothetical protein CM15mV11_1540 [Caudoviricetes sp.]
MMTIYLTILVRYSTIFLHAQVKSLLRILTWVSATISIPLDKEARNKCMEAVAIHNEYRTQLTANKRLDFEIARLKNCGELKKQGIVFHPNSPYYSVCADVMLINPLVW